MFENPIFSLLFFVHGYPRNGCWYIIDISNMALKHSDLVNCLSGFFF